MRRSFLVILNPNSGTSTGKRSDFISARINSIAAQNNCNVEILFTEGRSHATLLVEQNKAKANWAGVVAVGGDGTINEIAQPLIGSDIPVGIVPLGSGNGLARHLQIPISLEKSISRLFVGKPTVIDTATLNNIPFLCTAGMGFDAYVGHLFSQQKVRGLATYVNVSFQSYWRYKPQSFRLNGKKTNAFSLSFANAGQFGNNAWVAPQASLQDGKLDICIIKPFPKWYGTSLAYQLFTKQMKASRFIDYQSTTSAVVETDVPPLIHYDGEPLQLDTTRIEVKILPKSLQVIV